MSDEKRLRLRIDIDVRGFDYTMDESELVNDLDDVIGDYLEEIDVRAGRVTISHVAHDRHLPTP